MNSITNYSTQINNFTFKSFWETALKSQKGITLRIEQHISDANEMTALFDVLTQFPLIGIIDFSEATFSDDAFSALVNAPKEGIYQLNLPWVPLQQLFELTPDKLNHVSKLLFHPPKSGNGDEIELLIQFVRGFYDQTDQFAIDLSQWHLSPFQENQLLPFAAVGLQLDLDQRVKLDPFLDPYGTKADCKRWWSNYLRDTAGSTEFLLNPTTSYMSLNSPIAIIALFEVFKEEHYYFSSLDLTNTLFSDEAWSALVDGLNRWTSPVISFQADTVTVDQIGILLRGLTDEAFANLRILDISRDTNIVTRAEDKLRLGALLAVYLPKCKNLHRMHIGNWYFEECGFLILKKETAFFIENHWIKRTEHPKVHLDQTLLALDDNASLFCDTQFDAETLSVLWSETIAALVPPAITISSENAMSVVADSPLSIQTFFTLLEDSPKFQSLTFHGLQFTERAWEVIHQNVLWNSSITSVHFHRCQLTPKMISSLKTLNLRDLSLNSNADLVEKEAFCQAIGEVIRESQNLNLQLKGNLLTDDDLKMIFPAPCSLKSLCLNENCITKQGEQHLKSMNIGKIELFDNPMPDPKETTPLDDLLQEIGKVDLLTKEFYLQFQEKISILFPWEKEICFRQLLSVVFKIENVPADGNCLFHACSIGSTYTHQDLRKATVDYIEALPAVFSPHMEDNRTFEEYTALMRKDMSWGGNAEIVALCELLGCPIAVYSKEYPLTIEEGKLRPNPHTIYDASGLVDIFNHPKTIFLYRSGENHYLKLTPQ